MNELMADWGLLSEAQRVWIIKTHFLTPDQREWLATHDLDIYDILNGRFPANLEEYVVTQLFAHWNALAGYHAFGF